MYLTTIDHAGSMAAAAATAADAAAVAVARTVRCVGGPDTDIPGNTVRILVGNGKARTTFYVHWTRHYCQENNIN